MTAFRSSVEKFLGSIARSSIRSRRSYSSGLVHLENFLKREYPGYNSETVLKQLLKKKINVYELLDGFVSYILITRPGITPKSISLYLAALRSYFGYYDIDIIPSKFKRKVKVPKIYREDEEPLDVSDIRKILLSCNNRRLKPLLLVLGSGAMRITEALAIRNKDIDFSVAPTKVHIRKEYSKTRVARDIYISNEATYYLKQWLTWKYKDLERPRRFTEEDLVFAVYQTSNNPNGLYPKVWFEFEKVLSTIGFDQRKDGGINKRRKVTLHSLRRFAKGVISNQVNQDYSEWFFGHSKSPYYTLKELERREIYATKCMKYLSFLDYETLDITGKNIEAKLSEKDKEIQLLRDRDSLNTTAIADLSDKVVKLTQEMNVLKKGQRQIKSSP